MIYQENDIQLNYYINWISLEPKYLDKTTTIENIKKTLHQQILHTVDAKYGFILSVGDINILDNIIGEYGNVEFFVKAEIFCVLPKIGMRFLGEIITMLPDGCILANPHLQNLLIGGTLNNNKYIFPCGCMLSLCDTALVEVETVIFQRGKYTCICRHIC